MHSEHSPPWAVTAPVTATVGLVVLGLGEQFVLELLGRGYDLTTALSAAGVLSLAAAEFVYRLFRCPSQPSNGAGPRGLLPA